VCSQTDEVREKKRRGVSREIERALVLGAVPVLHPGSWKGLTRDEGLKRGATRYAAS